MRRLILWVFAGTLLLSQTPFAISQRSPSLPISADSDLDGLSDELEQSLLQKFMPTFMKDQKECSDMPAEFRAEASSPEVKAENGTIYGQVSPLARDQKVSAVELHFYHLWKMDCGSHGHPLDAEHVSALVRSSASGTGYPAWKAAYWYAAAHEDTVCDVSQITRASTVKAEDRGATAWISLGKHASFLDPELCHRGCGSDRCAQMQRLTITKIVNLGELGRPMNGSLWTSSAKWPLSSKMKETDFPPASLVRLEALPQTEIAWVLPGRHPAQGMIAISDSTAGAIGTSRDDALTAISVASGSTGNALGKSYRRTIHAIGNSARRLGALRPKSNPE